MSSIPKIITISDFHSPQLGNTRDLHIYLPPSYHEQPDRRYPVLYMHDGQNLFDPQKASYGVAWNVHTTAERLMREGKIEEIIIVGIDNTDDRIQEYIHHGGTGKYADIKAKGLLYEDFLLSGVKPYIDAHYRTLQNPTRTALLGSSLGGLVSLYIGMRHPDVFGLLGVMSPSFWWADRVTLRDLQDGTLHTDTPLKIWLDAGDAEVSTTPNYVIEDARAATKALEHQGYTLGQNLRFHIAPGAAHNETAWAARVHLPLEFFFPAHEEEGR